jgi:hypothetical protein
MLKILNENKKKEMEKEMEKGIVVVFCFYTWNNNKYTWNKSDHMT